MVSDEHVNKARIDIVLAMNLSLDVQIGGSSLFDTLRLYREQREGARARRRGPRRNHDIGYPRTGSRCTKVDRYVQHIQNRNS